MSEVLEQAVTAWWAGDKNRKEFAYFASLVQGKDTAVLADKCWLSVDAIESYRNTYRLYYRNIESEAHRKLWDVLNIGLWMLAAKHTKDYTDAELMEKLQEAHDRRYHYRQFAAVLSVGSKPEWTVRLQRVVKNIWKLYTDYKPEIPPQKRERFEQAAKQFFDAVQELAEEEVTG